MSGPNHFQSWSNPSISGTRPNLPNPSTNCSRRPSIGVNQWKVGGVGVQACLGLEWVQYCRMRSNSLGLLATVATVAASLSLCIVLLQRSCSIPSDFQFQSHFSKRQAEMFYTKARHELRQSYWHAIRQN